MERNKKVFVPTIVLLPNGQRVVEKVECVSLEETKLEEPLKKK